MERKLIKQGVGLTVYLPKKWTIRNKLKPGDSVKITENNNDLIVSNIKEIEKKEIQLDINTQKETIIRTELVNAYRLGFDKIILKTNYKKNKLNEIINKFMIGVDIFQNSKNKYIIESMTEPDYNNFNNLIIKQFFILKNIILELGKTKINNDVYKIQKYDNFLKRAISKNILKEAGVMFLWRFLSKLTRIARLALHFQDKINEKNLKLNSIDRARLNQAIEMINMLEKAYLKKDSKIALETHITYNQFSQKIDDELKKRPIKTYNIGLILTELYLSCSPLIGFIQAQKFDNYATL